MESTNGRLACQCSVLSFSVQYTGSVFGTLVQYSVHWFSIRYTGSVFSTVVQCSVHWFGVQYTQASSSRNEQNELSSAPCGCIHQAGFVPVRVAIHVFHTPVGTGQSFCRSNWCRCPFFEFNSLCFLFTGSSCRAFLCQAWYWSLPGTSVWLRTG